MHLNPQPTLLQGWCLPMAPTPALHYSAPITSLPAQVLAPSCLSILHSSFFFFQPDPRPPQWPQELWSAPNPNLQQDQDIIKEQHTLCPQWGDCHRYVPTVLQESASRGAEHILVR